MASSFKGKWRARIKFRGLEVFLGYYPTQQEAEDVEFNYCLPRWKDQESWMKARPTGKGGLQGMWKKARDASTQASSSDPVTTPGPTPGIALLVDWSSFQTTSSKLWP